MSDISDLSGGNPRNSVTKGADGMKTVFCVDNMSLNPERVSTHKHEVFGEVTVFHDVVIASEIVQPYEDGRAWKSRDELENYAWTVDGRWVIVGGHPADGIISSKDQVSGRTVNPRYVKDLKDPKTGRPCRAGVRADLEVFNAKVAPETLQDMVSGEKQDVSIGFFYSKDDSSGVVEDGPFEGVEYDYVQRDMFHDHTAAGLDNGRCPMPYCGLGADEISRRLMGDPFAGFSSFAECLEEMQKPKDEGGQGYTEEQAEKVCGKLKAEHEDDYVEGKLLNKSKDRLILLLEEAYEELRGEIMARREDRVGDWWRRIDWTENVDLYEGLSEDTQGLIVEAGLCPTCDKSPRSEAERAMSHFDLTEEEWEELSEEEKQEYIDRLPDRGEGGDAEWSTQYINNLPDSAFAYIEGGGEKDDEDKTKPRSLRHLPFKDENGNIDKEHLLNALSRLPQTEISSSAKSEAQSKLCGAVETWNSNHDDKIESEVCDTDGEEESEEDTKEQEDKIDPYDVLQRFDELVEQPFPRQE